MSEVQIAVIDQQPVQVAVIDDVNLQLALAAPTQTTNIAVAFPGVQGPVGVGFPAAGGTVNQLLVKQSSADSSTYTSLPSSLTTKMFGSCAALKSVISRTRLPTRARRVGVLGRISA